MTLIANAARGEVIAILAGAPRKLCLTLGALAELEGAFGVTTLEGLAERLRRLSATDLIAVLAALLRGGGEGEAAETLAAAPIDIAEAAAAVAAAFEAAGVSPAWAAMLRCAVALGLAPEAFWRLSLAEWRALSADPALPGLSRAAFEGLAARYPDDRHG